MKQGADLAALALVPLGLGIGAAVWAMQLVSSHGGWPFAYLRGYLLAWAGYVPAGILTLRGRRLPRWAPVWIVVAAIGLRALALSHPLPLSTDVWRYLWDGRVANAGINPYRYPPHAPELKPLRDDNWRPINYKHVLTIYPAFAQMVFAGLARVHPGDARAYRLAFALCDVGSVFVLLALLRRTGRPPEHVIWYAWCPLPIGEFGAGTHVDSVAVCLLLLSFSLAARAQSRPGAASAVALAASVMTKGFALLAAPFFIRRGGWRFAAWFAATCLLLVAPFLGAGDRLFDGLFTYLGAWKVNASLFLLANWLLQRVTSAHFLIARLASLAAVVAVVAMLAWRQRPGLLALMGSTFTALAAQLLLGAPTMPWYVAWVAPALCWWRPPALVALTLTITVQYYARWLYPDLGHLLLWLGYSLVYALLIGQGAWVWLQARSAAAKRPSRP